MYLHVIIFICRLPLTIQIVVEFYGMIFSFINSTFFQSINKKKVMVVTPFILLWFDYFVILFLMKFVVLYGQSFLEFAVVMKSGITRSFETNNMSFHVTPYLSSKQIFVEWKSHLKSIVNYFIFSYGFILNVIIDLYLSAWS